MQLLLSLVCSEVPAGTLNHYKFELQNDGIYNEHIGIHK